MMSFANDERSDAPEAARRKCDEARVTTTTPC